MGGKSRVNFICLLGFKTTLSTLSNCPLSTVSASRPLIQPFTNSQIPLTKTLMEHSKYLKNSRRLFRFLVFLLDLRRNPAFSGSKQPPFITSTQPFVDLFSMYKQNMLYFELKENKNSE